MPLRELVRLESLCPRHAAPSETLNEFQNHFKALMEDQGRLPTVLGLQLPKLKLLRQELSLEHHHDLYQGVWITNLWQQLLFFTVEMVAQLEVVVTKSNHWKIATRLLGVLCPY